MTSEAYVYHPGESELRWFGETSTHFLATGDHTDGEFALVEEQSKRGERVPLHRHEDDRESFYVLGGEVSYFLGDQPGVRASAGAFVHVPAGAVHGFRVESETARYLILTTARHGEFYRAITMPSQAGGLPPDESIEGSEIGKAAKQYGIEFIGPLPDEV